MKFSYPSGSQPLEGYTIKRGIGVGGFGEVYFAISDAGKEVALKKIQRNLDVELRGVRHCLNLKHVNLISLWDIRTNGCGESWVVMEYVPGSSLQDVVEAHPRGMPELEIKRWFSATAAGVAHLHKHGIVHRDLKPANIFHDDDEQLIKIGDYGLSKFISCSRRSGHTESVGTFHYMAPEIGNGVYGKEVDLYALGIIFYEMLTGDVPFDGESSQEIMMKHLTADVRLEKVPPAFHRVIRIALRKDPQTRFGSVDEMLAELPWRDGTTKARAAEQGWVDQFQGIEEDEHSGRGATIKPLFVSGEHSKNLVELGDDESSFDNSDIHQTLGKSTADYPPRSTDQADPSSDDSQTLASQVELDADPVGRMGGNVQTLSSDSQQRNLSKTSPASSISGASLSSWMRLRWWWTDSVVATMAKFLILASALAVGLADAGALMTVGIAVAIGCVGWYLVRHRVVPLQITLQSPIDLKATHPGKHPGKHLDTSQQWQASDKQGRYLATMFGVNEQQLAIIRRWLLGRSSRERMTEFLGSLLVAALSCVVLNLLAVTVCPRSESLMLDEVWAWYGWLTLTSTFSCVLLLLFGKLWEHYGAPDSVRRWALVGVGCLTSSAGWLMMGFFRVGFDRDWCVENGWQWNASIPWISFAQLSYVPERLAWPLWWIGILAVLRWWHLSDPARKTRLSIKVAQRSQFVS